MDDKEEQFSWEREKSRRNNSFPRPHDFNRSCYEVFDSFSEFCLNGKPYNLNDCGGLPKDLEESNSIDFEMPLSLRSRVVEEKEEIRKDDAPAIHPQTDAYLWAQAKGVEFSAWDGAVGAERLKVIRENNLPYSWSFKKK
jgi:hypothetical protein